MRLPRVDKTRRITKEIKDTFDRDGALVLRRLLSDEWVHQLRSMAERNLRHPGPLCDEHAAAANTTGRFHDDQFLWKRHDAAREYALRSGIGNLAAHAMGSQSACLLYDQLFVKEPGTAAPTPWHNDTSYWHLSGSQICSAWVALDNVPKENGLSYVRGSHKWGLNHRVTNFSGTDASDKNVYRDVDFDALPPVPDVDAHVAAGEYELLAWDMEPGDVLLFYSAVLHGAPGVPASSANRRRGFATRWCGDDVVFDDRPGTMHTGWKAHGFDCGLTAGQRIECALHPNVVPLVADEVRLGSE